jgi:hypothetical protein
MGSHIFLLSASLQLFYTESPAMVSGVELQEYDTERINDRIRATVNCKAKILFKSSDFMFAE